MTNTSYNIEDIGCDGKIPKILLVVPKGPQVRNGIWRMDASPAERLLDGWQELKFPKDKTDKTILSFYNEFVYTKKALVDVVKFIELEYMDYVEFEEYDAILFFHFIHSDEGIEDIRKNVKNANIWFVKESYIAEKLEIDRMGYSGWSELCFNPSVINLETLDEELVEKTFSTYQAYIKDNNSKINNSCLKYENNEKFILVVGQRNNDKVVENSYFGEYEETIRTTLNILDTFGLPIIYKSHPFVIDPTKQTLREVGFERRLQNTDFTNIRILNDSISIHDLIQKSLCVITISSGVGFEALLQCKNVFTLGSCDYKMATHECRTLNDISEIKEKMKGSPDSTMIKNFLYAYDAYKLVDCTDITAILNMILNPRK